MAPPVEYENSWEGILDRHLCYYTLKFVKIRDARLGVCNYCFKFLIFIYIVVFTIGINCGQLKVVFLNGNGVLRLLQPTVDSCSPNDLGCNSDYIPASQEPYCSQYAGKEGLPGQKECEFFDQWSFARHEVVPGAYFLPTQRTYYNMNKSSGDKFMLDEPKETFVTDPVNFKVTINPWVVGEGSELIPRAPKLFLRTASPDKRDALIDKVYNYSCPTYWGETGHFSVGCPEVPDPKSAERVSGNLAKLKEVKDEGGVVKVKEAEALLETGAKAQPPSAAVNPPPKLLGELFPIPSYDEYMHKGIRIPGFPSVHYSDSGIEINFLDLMRLCVGEKGDYLLDMVNMISNKTYRESGSIISLGLYYTNRAKMDPLGVNPVSLELTGQWLPVNLIEHPKTVFGDSGDQQVLQDRGILVLTRVHANLQMWNTSVALTVFAAALALLAVSTAIIDNGMVYLPIFDTWKYNLIKFQPWVRPIIDPYLYPPAAKIPAAKTFETCDIYRDILFDCLDNREDGQVKPRTLSKYEILAFLTKLDQRVTCIDAMHRIDTPLANQLQLFTWAFECGFIEKKCATKKTE